MGMFGSYEHLYFEYPQTSVSFVSFTGGWYRDLAVVHRLFLFSPAECWPFPSPTPCRGHGPAGWWPQPQRRQGGSLLQWRLGHSVRRWLDRPRCPSGLQAVGLQVGLRVCSVCASWFQGLDSITLHWDRPDFNPSMLSLLEGLLPLYSLLRKD